MRGRGVVGRGGGALPRGDARACAPRRERESGYSVLVSLWFVREGGRVWHAMQRTRDYRKRMSAG